MEGMLNSAMYNLNTFQPVLLVFLQQEGNMLFQKDNTHPHKAHATQHVLQNAQDLSWLAGLPNLFLIEQTHSVSLYATLAVSC